MGRRQCQRHFWTKAEVKRQIDHLCPPRRSYGDHPTGKPLLLLPTYRSLRLAGRGEAIRQSGLKLPRLRTSAHARSAGKAISSGEVDRAGLPRGQRGRLVIDAEWLETPSESEAHLVWLWCDAPLLQGDHE